MLTSSLIEMTYIAYGWILYGHIFLLLKMSGIILLPFLFLGINSIIQSAVADEEDGYNVRDVGAKLFVMILIYILSVPPMVKLELDPTQVQTLGCGNVNINMKPPIPLDLFGKDGTWNTIHVPMIPYLTMQLANTVRGYIRATVPCMTDVSVRALASAPLTLQSLEDTPALQERVNEFAEQCYKPALSLNNEWLKSGNEASNVVYRNLLSERNIKYDDSNLGMSQGVFTTIFYSGKTHDGFQTGATKCDHMGYGHMQCQYVAPKIEGVDEELAKIKARLPLVYRGSMGGGVSTNETACHQSEVQKTKEGTCVDCIWPWWGKSSVDGPPAKGSIAYDIIYNHIHTVFRQAVVDSQYQGKAPSFEINLPGYDSGWIFKEKIDVDAFIGNRQNYINSFINKLDTPKASNLVDYLFVENVEQLKGTEISSGAQIGGAVAMGIGSIANAAVSGNIVGGAANLMESVGATVFTMETIIESMKIILPMTQAFIFALWGIILITIFYRPQGLWKAVLALFILMMVPAGWDMADALTNSLHDTSEVRDAGWKNMAAFAGYFTIYAIRMIFYIITPAILFAVINIGAASLSASVLSAGGIGGALGGLTGAAKGLGAGRGGSRGGGGSNPGSAPTPSSGASSGSSPQRAPSSITNYQKVSTPPPVSLMASSMNKN